MCPPGYLDSHARGNTGAYDSIVVEAGEGLEGAALGQVTDIDTVVDENVVGGKGKRGRGGWGDVLLLQSHDRRSYESGRCRTPENDRAGFSAAVASPNKIVYSCGWHGLCCGRRQRSKVAPHLHGVCASTRTARVFRRPQLHRSFEDHSFAMFHSSPRPARGFVRSPSTSRIHFPISRKKLNERHARSSSS